LDAVSVALLIAGKTVAVTPVNNVDLTKERLFIVGLIVWLR
jgi:hypothetical protein